MSDESRCCPEFDPAPWQKATHEWKEKPFLFATIPQIFHMPFPPMLRRVMSRMWNRAKELGVAPEMKDFLFLAYDPSPWKSELYLAVTTDVPGPEAVRLTGTFISMAFDGPYSGVPKYIKEMEAHLRSLGRTAKKYYFYFTTCPKCAKKYGHNWIVGLVEV